MQNAIVTLAIQHHVLSNAQPQYEAWLSEIMPVAQSFAGHLGINVIRPAHGTDVYTMVLRFDTDEHLRDWVDSETRRSLIARVQPFLAADEKIDIITGLEYWFTPQGPAPKKASPFKQFLVTLSAIFPLTVIVPLCLTPLFKLVPVLGMPIISNFIVAMIIVFLMTYVIMPRYTKLIAGWLFR
jgi:antibiotic biosynthesis monooxygenase (ABM) superfamily enzyme